MRVILKKIPWNSGPMIKGYTHRNQGQPKKLPFTATQNGFPQEQQKKTENFAHF